jgi:formate C-acetyltransferase
MSESMAQLATVSQLDQVRCIRLRDMHWRGTYRESVTSKYVGGVAGDTPVDYAEDFAKLLEASDPFIQADELIVGCCLVTPEDEINTGFYNAHYPPGYATLLREGLPGIRDWARRRVKEESDPEKRAFLCAVEISYEAACRYSGKHADLAREMAVMEDDPSRMRDLRRIASACDELVTQAPASFHAALQLVQFTRIFGGRGCIGRFDQWMFPFYQNDIEAGRITEREAQELLECLFVKLNHFPEARQATNDNLRNITLGGQTASGEDACNALSYACLEASVKLMLPEPKLNTRFFPGSSRRWLQRCCRVLAKGGNVLAVYNDEVAVPALARLGIPLEDARDYCNDGCSELLIGGKSTLRFQVHDALPVLTETVMEAEHRAYETFEDVMADFKSRLMRYVPDDHGKDYPVTSPYFAATIEDCLENASPNGARYTIAGSILAQVGNAADGLAAIKKLIYDEGVLEWDELVAALKEDYAGSEPLRQMLRNRAPKYGNDDDYVDGFAREIAEYFCESVHEHARNSEGRGNKRAPGLMCFGIHRKQEIPASPDGRRKGDQTANSFSPSVGMDRSGPTAVLRSVAKTDLTKASHGSVLDLALHSAILQGEEAFEKFVALIDGFLKMRGPTTLQLNIVDRDTLLRAREHPDSDEFRTLIVRVWGFSAVFVDLPVALQDHVLARTEHGEFG